MKELELFNRDEIIFEWNTGIQSVLRIKKFLLDVDSTMIPKLAGRVDIKAYAQKLAENAENLFLIYHMMDMASCSVYCNREVAYISSIAVKNEYQNLGVGDLMMKEIMKHVREKCIRSIRLHVYDENYKAIKYYLKHSFIVINHQYNWIEMESMVN